MFRKGFIAAVCCVLAAGSTLAQEMPKPGPEHEMLKKLVGEWDVTMKMHGQESKGSSTFKMELNGFYLSQHFQCDFGGMKFEGKGTSSYCPVRKKYVGVWTDNMSPSLSIMYGHMVDEKTMIEEGEMPDMTGKMRKMRAKSVWKDADTQNFTMHQLNDDGKEEQMFEIIYKRKK